MKRIIALTLLFAMFSAFLCSCKTAENGNGSVSFAQDDEPVPARESDAPEPLTEDDIAEIKETMYYMQQIVANGASSVFIMLDTLKVMRIAGSAYSSSQLKKQFDDCCDRCSELLRDIEAMVGYYNRYSGLFTSVKPAVDELITIHDGILKKADLGNGSFSFDEDLMKDISEKIRSWDEKHSNAFSALIS